MITHYGLFWSERDVYWGKPKVPGEMLGREKTLLGRRGAPTKTERSSAKDYRGFIGIYCLYGDGELLYVGETGLTTGKNLYDRLKEHRTGSLASRWDRFSWFGRQNTTGTVAITVALAHLEAVTIAAINPGFNKQAGAFKGAVQVYQVPHELAEGDVETKLARLAATIKGTGKGTGG